MCLGIPVKVIEIDDEHIGRVDYLGTRIKANLVLIDNVKVGDWVIIHAGYAISKLDEEDAQETLDLLREITETTEDAG